MIVRTSGQSQGQGKNNGCREEQLVVIHRHRKIALWLYGIFCCPLRPITRMSRLLVADEWSKLRKRYLRGSPSKFQPFRCENLRGEAPTVGRRSSLLDIHGELSHTCARKKRHRINCKFIQINKIAGLSNFLDWIKMVIGHAIQGGDENGNIEETKIE